MEKKLEKSISVMQMTFDNLKHQEKLVRNSKYTVAIEADTYDDITQNTKTLSSLTAKSTTTIIFWTVVIYASYI